MLCQVQAVRGRDICRLDRSLWQRQQQHVCAAARVAGCDGCWCWQGADCACSASGNAMSPSYFSTQIFHHLTHTPVCPVHFSIKFLIFHSSQAARRCGIVIRVFALDKNPNAVITLRNLIRTEEWGEFVTVVSSDMRLWQAPCQADIMVRRVTDLHTDAFPSSSHLHFRSQNYWDHSATTS